MAWLILLLVAASVSKAQVAANPPSLFKITSGSYTMVGGIWGSITSRLPASNQAFVALSINPQNGRAEMSFLGEDQETALLTLTNGVVSGDLIHFYYLTRHPYVSVEELGTVDYTVTNKEGLLRIDGSTEFPPICCDIPYQYSHSNVVAVALPVASLRVSEVEVSWRSASNHNYQVQYRSDLTTNQWVDLGLPIVGAGSWITVLDKVAVNQPRRFYQVLLLP